MVPCGAATPHALKKRLLLAMKYMSILKQGPLQQPLRLYIFGVIDDKRNGPTTTTNTTKKKKKKEKKAVVVVVVVVVGVVEKWRSQAVPPLKREEGKRVVLSVRLRSAVWNAVEVRTANRTQSTSHEQLWERGKRLGGPGAAPVFLSAANT